MIPYSELLLDTNTVSELSKPRPNARVVAYFQRVRRSRAFISVLTLGELRKGVAQQAMRHPNSPDRLERWLQQLEADFAERVLAVDRSIAHLWGELSSQRTRPVIDTLLAATARRHGLTLVTRNTRDMEDTGVPLYNPWGDPDLD